MPTETEQYIDDELLRDAERSLEAERAHEDFENEEDFEDESEIEDETDDPVLNDVLKYKGGEPEDWELTHRSSGEYMFDGKEMIDTRSGESLTEKIDSGYDDAYRTAHHETLEQLKSGESMIRLPDYVEERDGEEILHVTHLLRAPDGSVSYEIRSTVISEYEDDENFEAEVSDETHEEVRAVEFHEKVPPAVEGQVEAVPETIEHIHETTFDSGVPAETHFASPIWLQPRETPIVNEVVPDVAEIKEEVVEQSWLTRFLREESPAPVIEQEKIFESLPVFVASVEEKTVEVPVEQARLAQQEQVASFESKFIADEHTNEQVEQSTAVSAPEIEQAPLYNEPITRLVREVVIPKMEQRIVEEKIEQKSEPVTVEVASVREPISLMEHRERLEEVIETKSSGEKLPQDQNVRSSTERDRLAVQESVKIAHEKPVQNEMIDGPVEVASKTERPLSGEEILQRALGVPAAPRIVSRESAHMEGLRPTRYSPPQQDEVIPSRSNNSARTLNGISMRRAA